MDARKMFAVVAHTTLLSLLVLSSHFSKLCSDFTVYYIEKQESLANAKVNARQLCVVRSH